MQYRHLAIIAVAAVTASACEGPGKAPSHHDAATRRFEDLQKGGFQATRDEIQAAFIECFPQGMETATVNDLLATGSSENRGNGEIAYRWFPDPRDRSYCLEVVVMGDPAIVKSAWIHVLPSS